MAITTSAERTVLVSQETRRVFVERQTTSADRTVYATED